MIAGFVHLVGEPSAAAGPLRTSPRRPTPPRPAPAASQVITRLFTFGLNLATARSLTPEAYGVRG